MATRAELGGTSRLIHQSVCNVKLRPVFCNRSIVPPSTAHFITISTISNNVSILHPPILPLPLRPSAQWELLPRHPPTIFRQPAHSRLDRRRPRNRQNRRRRYWSANRTFISSSILHKLFLDASLKRYLSYSEVDTHPASSNAQHPILPQSRKLQPRQNRAAENLHHRHQAVSRSRCDLGRVGWAAVPGEHLCAGKLAVSLLSISGSRLARGRLLLLMVWRSI
jgi:hypothetical protein